MPTFQVTVSWLSENFVQWIQILRKWKKKCVFWPKSNELQFGEQTVKAMTIWKCSSVMSKWYWLWQHGHEDFWWYANQVKLLNIHVPWLFRFKDSQEIKAYLFISVSLSTLSLVVNYNSNWTGLWNQQIDIQHS